MPANVLKVTSQPQLVLAGAPLVPNSVAANLGYTLVNNDTLNTIWISSKETFASTDPDAIPIPPQASAPLDPTRSTYAIALAGNTVQALLFPGGGSWANPVGVQVALNALGLATAANQATQTAALNTGNTNTGNTATNTGTTATNTGNTATNTGNLIPPIETINGTTVSLSSHYPNPDMTAPNGNADITGWTNSGGTIATAGINGSVANPAGSGEANSAYCVASGSNSFLGIFPGCGIPCNPGQTPYGHFKMYGAGLSGPYFGQVSFQFYNSSAGFISSVNVNTIVTNNNAWQKFFAVCTSVAPATTAYCVVTPALIIGAGNIPNTVSCYITAVMAGILGQPGTHGGDHAQAIANTGVPLLNFGSSLSGGVQTVSLPDTGAFITEGPYTITQPGYELWLSLAYAIAAPSGNPITCTLIWKDSASGEQIETEQFCLYPGASTGNAHIMTFKGPSKSNELLIQFKNDDTLSAVTAIFNIFQNSRVLPRSIGKTLQIPTQFAASTYFSAFGNPSRNIIGSYTNASLAAASSEFIIVSMYNGDCMLNLGSGLGVNPPLSIQAWPVDSVASGAPLYQNYQQTDAGIEDVIAMPRTEVVFQIANHDAANAHAVNFSLIAKEEGT